ncbi:MAG: invasion associated locus B family protein [Bradyrhizobiaceae bacterium]|nr:invasion associated locus B family protein [Bradyrhizobiaceae bacterium]
MSHRKLSAPWSSARRLAVSTIAATLLSATGFCVNIATAQQPKTAQTKPAPAAKPGKPATATPAANTPSANPPGNTAAQQPPQAPQLPPLVYSPWAKFCGKGPDPNAKDAKEVCFTGKDGRTEGGQPVVAAALIEPTGEAEKRFRVTLPSPLQIEFGTRLIIDQDQPLTGRFFTCYANVCMVDYVAMPELVSRLKKGTMLQIQAISLAGEPVTFPLPLTDSSGNSFQKAAEGPPTDPKVFEEQQKKLQEDLQKRAEEMRKKLEAQQSAPAK